MRRVVLAGGSGFIGRAVAQTVVAAGGSVVILSRRPDVDRPGITQVRWDGATPGDWFNVIDGASALVNLAGRNVNCRFTPDNLREILASRVDSIAVLGQAIRAAAAPPPVWINAGGKDIYGDSGDAPVDESSPPGPGMLTDVCVRWEAAFAAADAPRTRKALLRIGVVLGDDGALPMLARLTRLFMGGAQGNGRQYLSWIHHVDMVRMIAWACANPAVTGVYNAVAPSPVTNAEFMRELRRVLRRPWCPPAPGPLVRLGAALLGSEGGLVLEGNRVLPKRAVSQGFAFQFPELAPALRDLMG